MGSEDGNVSSRAEYNLIRYYGSRAIPYLLNACDDPDPQVRFRAVWALAKTRDPSAFETVLRLTNDRDERVRYDAILGLGVLGDTRAIEPLSKMVLLKDPTVPACEALCYFGSLAIDAFRKLNLETDPVIRQYAVGGLGSLLAYCGTQVCLALLKESLLDPDPYVREEARYWLESEEDTFPEAGG